MFDNPDLNDAEVRLLALLETYESDYAITYDELCQHTEWSRRKLKRTITSLGKKKLLKKYIVKKIIKDNGGDAQ
jgi:hypothetical protein